MTEQRRREIRAELARRMGWDFIQSPSEIALPDTGEWYTPFGRNYGSEPPDPFTNAEDYYSMLAWMARDENLWSSFDAKMKHDLGLAPMATAIECGRAFITASRETITLAAARALGIETE